MTEDSSAPEHSDLPRFVRDVGVLGSAGPRQRFGMGVLPALHGVLDVGVEGSGGVPPALNHLTLPEIVASGLNRTDGERPSPRTADAAASGSDPRSPDDEADTKVYHVLRSDSDDLGDRLGSDIGESRSGERSAGEGTSSERSPGGGTVDGRTTGGSGRNRSDPSDETADSTPRVLRGDWDGGGRLTNTVARPPTVLATASIPGRAENTGAPSGRPGEAAPTRPAASDSDRSGADARTPVDTERRTGSADRSETVDHSLGGRDGGDGSTGRGAGGDGTAADDRGRSGTGLGTVDDGALTVASARGSDDASSSGTTSVPTDRDASLPDWTTDRHGPDTGRGASTPRLTVLQGSTSGGSAGGSKAGGSTLSGGRSARHTEAPGDGSAGSGSPATGSTGAGPIGADAGPIGGPEASSVDRQAVAQFPFPRNLSLEGGGPDTQFLEEVYRELTKKMRNERQRGWY